MRKKLFVVLALLVFVIGSVSAVDIRDRDGRLAGRLDGNTIRDSNGRQIGRIDGNTIRDSDGRQIGSAFGDPAQVKMVALLAFFFFYLI